MFEVVYDGKKVSVNPDQVLSILRSHMRKELNITSLKLGNHSLNYESLINVLKL